MGETSKCGQELLSPIWEKVILQPEGGQLGGLRDWGCTLRKCIVAAAFSIDQIPESGYWTSSPPTERPQKIKSQRRLAVSKWSTERSILVTNVHVDTQKSCVGYMCFERIVRFN